VCERVSECACARMYIWYSFKI